MSHFSVSSLESYPRPASPALPLVSVIIPVFNAASFLAEAIESVLQQDYPHLEILIVDDGSTDQSLALARRFEGGRIRVFAQTNRGCAAARNLGLRHAGGSYIAFLDADDVWAADKLSRQVQALRGSGLRMAYSRFICWHPDAQGNYPASQAQFGQAHHPDLSTCALVSGNTYRHLLLDCIVWTSTVLVEKSALDELGSYFDEALQLGEDYDLWLRLAQKLDMLGLEQPTALYRQHPTSLTRRARPINYEYLVLSRALQRWGEGSSTASRKLSRPLRMRLARSLFNHAYQHHKGGSAWVAVRSYWASMRQGGFRLKAGILLVLALCRTCLPGKLS